MVSTDRSFEIASRAVSMMRAYCDRASPSGFEVWFTFAEGGNTRLNLAIGALMARQKTLSPADIERLRATHLGSGDLLAATERVGAGVAGEIDVVAGLIDRALVSALSYGTSLASIVDEQARAEPTAEPKEMIDLLMVTTREVVEANRTLETRIRQSRAEVDALRCSLDSVRRESLTDPLTDLANRRCLDAALAEACARSAAEGSPLALVLLDIDHFKRFNDLYGHVTGDQVLRLVCATMRDCVNENATLARFGGEEFAILLPGRGLGAAMQVAENVRVGIGRRELLKRSTGESLGQITVSLGVVTALPGETSGSLLQRADLCLYAAKRGGRNRTVGEADVPQSLVEMPIPARVA